MSVSFQIDGEPIPQSRPRFSKFGHAYTSKRCRDFRNFVALCAKNAMENKKIYEKNVPISAAVLFYRRKKAVARGDLDNLLKAIFDACNNIVFRDDSQIIEVYCQKIQSDHPHTSVLFRKAD